LPETRTSLAAGGGRASTGSASWGRRWQRAQEREGDEFGRTLARAHGLEDRLVAELVLARLDDEGELGVDVVGRLLDLLGLLSGSHCERGGGESARLCWEEVGGRAREEARGGRCKSPSSRGASDLAQGGRVQCGECTGRVHGMRRGRARRGRRGEVFVMAAASGEGSWWLGRRAGGWVG